MSKHNNIKDNQISIDTYIQVISRSYGLEMAEGLYKYWKAINELFYQDKLPPPLITFEVMPHGRAVGLCFSDRGHIKLLKRKKGIKLDPYTVGVLLHETIHYAEFYTEREETNNKTYYTSHNCPYWIDEINRIHKQVTGENLDAQLTIVTTKENKRIRQNKGSIALKQISTYPYTNVLNEKVYHYITDWINKGTTKE